MDVECTKYLAKRLQMMISFLLNMKEKIN